MEIKKMVDQQKDFFQLGKTIPVTTRKKALFLLQKEIQKNKKEILRALYQDLGKSSAEGYMTEVGLTLEELRYGISHLNRWASPKRRRSSIGQLPASCFEIPVPYGVTLIMSPWNYPFMLSMIPLIGAIAAGNCVVLKPSNDAPRTSEMIRSIIEKIYPPEYVTVVEGGREENTQLLDQQFDYIFFTGGGAVGRVVLEKAAVHLTPVTLELGGKSPCIVDKTANLRQGAKRIVFGKFLNSGQTCVAPDYLLVEESVQEELVGHLIQWTEKLLGKRPLENPQYSHMVNEKHYYRVLNLLKGEHIVLGGQGNSQTLQISPTILVDVKKDAPVMQEEIFGPVLPILTFQKIEEAENLIRQREKPLAFYLFSEDPQTIDHFIKEVPFGGGCINDTILHMASPYVGFGGVGASGYGRYHGKHTFDTFSHVKSVLRQPTWIDNPLRYPPYTKLKEKLFQLFLR